MGSKRPTGRYQIACEVTAGLHDAILERVTLEGLPVSAIIRRALMHELGVDAEGAPAKGGRK